MKAKEDFMDEWSQLMSERPIYPPMDGLSKYDQEDIYNYYMLKAEAWKSRVDAWLFENAENAVRAKSNQKKSRPYIALTLRPKDGEVKTCKEFARLVCQIKAIDACRYVFEQKAESGESYGWHLHFCIDADKAPSWIGQQVRQKLNNHGFKDGETYMIDYKSADENWEKKYMAGQKGGEKDPAAKYDPIVRKMFGLEDIYEYKRS